MSNTIRENEDETAHLTSCHIVLANLNAIGICFRRHTTTVLGLRVVHVRHSALLGHGVHMDCKYLEGDMLVRITRPFNISLEIGARG